MLKRLSNLIRGFFGLFISGLEKKSPEALLEVEKENLRSQIAKYNKGLAAHASICERLMTQVKKLTQEEDDLKAKAAAQLKAGNRAAAGKQAIRLQSVRQELADSSTQLEDAEKTYKELLEARDVTVKSVKDKIEELKRDISDVKVKQATAELHEMASGMITEIGGSGDTLNRLHDMVEEEREKAAGRARVAKDNVDFSEIKEQAAEQAASADLALADLAVELGLDLPGESDSGGEAPDSEAGTRTMGPGSKESESA